MKKHRRIFLHRGLGLASLGLPLSSPWAATPCPPPRFGVDGGTAATTVCGGPGAAGALVHGQPFTVTGSGFGTRADYNVDNYTWQGQRHMHWRFGDLAGGFPVSGSSQTTFTAALKGFYPSAEFEFNADYVALDLSILPGGPSQSGKYLRKVGHTHADSGYLEARSDSNAAVPDNPNAYTCYKHRGVGDGKIFRWWRSGLGSSGKNFYLGGTGAFRESDWPYDSVASYKNFNRSATIWSRHELVLDAARGSRFRVNGTTITAGVYKNNSEFLIGTFPLVNAGDSSRKTEFTWPNSVNDGATFDYADIYHDFTAARVEVSDGTHSEIQLLTAWSPTRISCAFNRGELRSGPGTVKVYDASDTVIHSGAVTIA